ncbi:MAG: UbiA family prenyltransferase, partial [Chitinispirillaceae bacterium]|nr:UbiA family prenyltransferase [Chitinispirillaceae bacterium]
MKTLVPYIKIARLNNVLMTGAAVALGYWLGRSTIPVPGLFLLIIAGIFTASFGNVINDLHDITADRINRRDRPLPKNDISRDSARIFAAYLAVTALGSAAFVSPLYLAWTALPILILLCYTYFLKSTPLAGNIAVSLLVAYALVYGALGAPDIRALTVPAALAFLLNLIREIIKDLQDEPGDRGAGTVTTASLPKRGIRVIIYLST